MDNSKVACKRHSGIVLIGDLPEQKLRVIKYARCKMWDCEYCARINMVKHRARIIEGINRLQGEGQYKFTFVTLTSHENVRGMVKSIYVWKSAWKKLSNRLRYLGKTEGCNIHYVFVAEQHRDKTLHIHGLFPVIASERWWKDNARECGLGYQVDSQLVRNAGLGAAYMTKYMVKHIGATAWPKNFRRINFSHSFPQLPVRKIAGDWSRANPFEALAEIIIAGWGKGLNVELFGEIIRELEMDDEKIETIESLSKEILVLRAEIRGLEQDLYSIDKTAKLSECRRQIRRLKYKIKCMLPTLFDNM